MSPCCCRSLSDGAYPPPDTIDKLNKELLQNGHKKSPNLQQLLYISKIFQKH